MLCLCDFWSICLTPMPPVARQRKSPSATCMSVLGFEAAKDLGITEVERVGTGDETYTFNKRINRLPQSGAQSANSLR